MVSGKEVRLAKDVSETDKYGRLLRYVYVGSLFVNAELVKQGYANAATYPPDVKYADLFVSLEREARNKQIGLWTPPPTPTPSPTQIAPAEVQPAPQPAQGQFVGNQNTGKLHNLAHGSCQNYVRMMNESNKVFSTLSKKALLLVIIPVRNAIKNRGD